MRRCVWSRNIKNRCSIYIYIFDISSLRVNDLTLILLTWRKWTPNNASKWQMGFNSAFKWLKHCYALLATNIIYYLPLITYVWVNQFYGIIIRFFPQKNEMKLAAASTSAVTCGTPVRRARGRPAGRPPVSWTLIAEPCRFSPLHVLLLFVINAEIRGRDDTRRKSAVDVACMEMPCQCHFSSYSQREREIESNNLVGKLTLKINFPLL